MYNGQIYHNNSSQSYANDEYLTGFYTEEPCSDDAPLIDVVPPTRSGTLRVDTEDLNVGWRHPTQFNYGDVMGDSPGISPHDTFASGEEASPFTTHDNYLQACLWKRQHGTSQDGASNASLQFKELSLKNSDSDWVDEDDSARSSGPSDQFATQPVHIGHTRSQSFGHGNYARPLMNARSQPSSSSSAPGYHPLYSPHFSPSIGRAPKLSRSPGHRSNSPYSRPPSNVEAAGSDSTNGFNYSAWTSPNHSANSSWTNLSHGAASGVCYSMPDCSLLSQALLSVSPAPSPARPGYMELFPYGSAAPSPAYSQQSLPPAEDVESGWEKPRGEIKDIVGTVRGAVISDGRRASKEPPKFKCKFNLICQKRFTTKVKLLGHINAHNGVKPHVCKPDSVKEVGWGCSKGFARKCDLARHRKTCQKNPQRPNKAKQEM